MIDQDKFVELLSRYQRGDCTEQEKAVLESWLTFGHFDGPVYDDQVLDEKITRISDRLPLRKETSTRKIKLSRVIYIAASFAAIFIAVWVYNTRKNRGEMLLPTTTEIVAQIEPGKDQAFILLSDGRRVAVEDAESGLLALESGVKVTKSPSGEITYEVGISEKANPNTYNTIETPRGGQFRVNLPDGTKVWLNAASSLKFSTALSTVKERRIALNGEAYFEVTKDPDRPFIVKSGNQEVEVLGTKFNVSAYSEETNMKTTLVEGAVKVTSGSIKKQLKPDQQAIVSKSITIKPVVTEVELAWKNGDFNLESDDFRTVMRKISRWYDVEIEYDHSAPVDLELGGKIARSKSLASILRIMEATGDVRFKIEGRRIIVTK
ncbi:FecR family protein [Sphingobacterium tabacisoli]|uniref:FecR family protein n=1 Tax=Sphingobacterium tabacisoli TaxID=2044855 RepID=A0ABW5L970_9SPHI|nr:FecR domain-containing protein [Sphingobacterium tabacisoli]